MATFPGGSAYAMVRDIAEGYLLVTERTYSRFGKPELDQLLFELDRALRDVRGSQPQIDDLAAVQQRNRKIQRLNSAVFMLRSFRQRYRIAPGGGG